jgi:hypothetical protein
MGSEALPDSDNADVAGDDPGHAPDTGGPTERLARLLQAGVDY